MPRSCEVEVGWGREGRVGAEEVKGWFIWITFVHRVLDTYSMWKVQGWLLSQGAQSWAIVQRIRPSWISSVEGKGLFIANRHLTSY